MIAVTSDGREHRGFSGYAGVHTSRFPTQYMIEMVHNREPEETHIAIRGQNRVVLLEMIEELKRFVSEVAE